MLSRNLLLGEHNVPYLYGVDCQPWLAEDVLRAIEPADVALFVVDRAVTGHAAPVLDALASAVRVVPYPVEADEHNKGFHLVEAIAEDAIANRVTRRSVVIAMGGGLVGNVAGMVAAMLYRGLPLVHLPTTPVAAFDSVLSLKQAVNLSRAKNLAGTYLVPKLIACDLNWLATVPRQQCLTGLAEMAKNVIAVVPKLEETYISAMDRLADQPADALLDLLEIGINAKARFLRDDPYEQGPALVFEYGHTVGHALEFTAPGPMKHGEAVAWGMLAAAEVSREVTGLDAGDVNLHHRLLALLDLPDPRDRLGRLDLSAVAAALAADNKRGYVSCDDDEILMVLLEQAGTPVSDRGRYPLVPVPVEVALTALRRVAGSVVPAASGWRRHPG